MRWGTVLVFGCAAQLACGGENSSDAFASLDDLPRMTLVEEVRIGSTDDPGVGFTQIRDVRVEPGDTVWVAEIFTTQLRVYAPDGRLVRTIGLRGEGPGGLRSIVDWGLLGDTVWVRDWSLRRFTLFRRDGTVLATIPAPGVMFDAAPYSVMIAPAWLRPDGRLEGYVALTDPCPQRCDPSLPEMIVDIPHILFDAEGSPSDTIGTRSLTLGPSVYQPEDEAYVGSLRITMSRRLPETRLRHPAGDDTVFVTRPAAETAESGTITVTRVRVNGDTVLSRVLRYRPRPVEAAYRDSVVERRIQSYLSRTSDIAGLERTVRALMPFPDYYPPVASMLVGADGAIWLRRQPAEEDGWHWIRLTADASPVGEVILPAGAVIEWSDGDVIHVLERDDVDVPWVVRYRLESH